MYALIQSIDSADNPTYTRELEANESKLDLKRYAEPFFEIFIVGGLIVFQNNQLFGRDAINLTGIPLLKERARDGRPLYVCPQKTSETSK